VESLPKPAADFCYQMETKLWKFILAGSQPLIRESINTLCHLVVGQSGNIDRILEIVNVLNEKVEKGTEGPSTLRCIFAFSCFLMYQPMILDFLHQKGVRISEKLKDSVLLRKDLDFYALECFSKFINSSDVSYQYSAINSIGLVMKFSPRVIPRTNNFLNFILRSYQNDVQSANARMHKEKKILLVLNSIYEMLQWEKEQIDERSFNAVKKEGKYY
jgi:hypothetical protein